MPVSVTDSRANTTRWSLERFRLWRRSWCLILTWLTTMMLEAAAGTWRCFVLFMSFFYFTAKTLFAIVVLCLNSFFFFFFFFLSNPPTPLLVLQIFALSAGLWWPSPFGFWIVRWEVWIQRERLMKELFMAVNGLHVYSVCFMFFF